MAYSSFNNGILVNAHANTAGNKIVESLHMEFGVALTAQDFALSGTVAQFLQNPTDANSVRNIAFVTTNAQMYAYFVANVSALLSPLSVIVYADRIQIRLVANVYLEIWELTGTLATVVVENIVLQTSASIPAPLLTYHNVGTAVTDRQPLINNFDQIFNPGGQALYVQQWLLNPARVALTWIQGRDVPEDIEVSTVIRNYATEPEFSFFSGYQVEVVSNTGTGTGLISPFFNATINNSTTYIFNSNGLEVVTRIRFINFALLNGGQYESSVTYRITGLDSRTNTRTVMETVDLPVSLTVRGAGITFTDPEELHFVFLRNRPLPAPQEVYVSTTASTYPIIGSRMFTINGDGLMDGTTENFTVKRASGPTLFMVSVNSRVAALDNGVHNHVITVNGRFRINVVITVADDDTIVVSPPAFEFVSIRGVEEAAPQRIRVDSILPYTFQLPVWMGLSGNAGVSFNGVLNAGNSQNFAPGVYTGNIAFTSQAGTVLVPLTYTVRANGFSQLLPDRINFTQDQAFINFATKQTGNYLRVVYNLKWYEFIGKEIPAQYVQHIPIFNGLGNFHPGDFVHNIMDSLSDIEQFIPTDLENRVNKPFSYYLPAQLNLIMEQRSYTDDALVATTEINNVLFVKGTKPLQFYDDCGVLQGEHPIRVTPNSYGIVNFIKRTGVHTIEIYVNGAKQADLPHDTVFDSLFGLIVSFAGYSPGDLVYVRIGSGNKDEKFERRFYVFPENKESYHIAWVTEHEQLELMEFTGGYSIESDYTRIENDVYKNLVRVTEILETNKTQPLTANTGWVLKNNHVLLDSLLRSKRAWLFLPNTDYKIALVPQTKKITNFDTETGQYAYDIEFKINPDNDAKVYPR